MPAKNQETFGFCAKIWPLSPPQGSEDDIVRQVMRTFLLITLTRTAFANKKSINHNQLINYDCNQYEVNKHRE